MFRNVVVAELVNLFTVIMEPEVWIYCILASCYIRLTLNIDGQKNKCSAEVWIPVHEMSPLDHIVYLTVYALLFEHSFYIAASFITRSVVINFLVEISICIFVTAKFMLHVPPTIHITITVNCKVCKLWCCSLNNFVYLTDTFSLSDPDVLLGNLIPKHSSSEISLGERQNL
jgi:hypothetical protein